MPNPLPYLDSTFLPLTYRGKNLNLISLDHVFEVPRSNSSRVSTIRNFSRAEADSLVSQLCMMASNPTTAPSSSSKTHTDGLQQTGSAPSAVPKKAASRGTFHARKVLSSAGARQSSAGPTNAGGFAVRPLHAPQKRMAHSHNLPPSSTAFGKPQLRPEDKPMMRMAQRQNRPARPAAVGASATPARSAPSAADGAASWR